MKVGVIGPGLMGQGISIVFARTGCEVLLVGRKRASLADGMRRIDAFLHDSVRRKKLSPLEKAQTLQRIVPCLDLKDIRDADLVVEAVPEDLTLKQALFRQLGRLCPPRTLLVSNTSSLSITQLAKVTSHPERVAGLHFFNPAPLLPLVEVVRGTKTSAQSVARLLRIASRIKKTPVLVRDSPGFIVNRTLFPLINEAIFLLQEKVASKEDIDMALKLGARHPLGPLELADLIGLDTCLEILTSLEKAFKSAKYRPARLLTQMVRQGRLGRKSGEGFYPS